MSLSEILYPPNRLATVELFQEIILLKRQGVKFTYELPGFSHSDIHEVFDWLRVSDNIQTRDTDGSWMKVETQSTNNSEDPINDIVFPQSIPGMKQQVFDFK